ncbi:MAG: iron-containing alcohol dehydrogenase, partial [Acidobacteriota bacterium]|nr:iron-containing alcohol dehydrogenase [Acidobacteriota bacterium]
MTALTLQQVPTLVFGPGALDSARGYLQARSILRPFLVTSPSNRLHAARLHPAALIDDSTRSEPTVAHFEALLATARAFKPDAIIGLGGGSPL